MTKLLIFEGLKSCYFHRPSSNPLLSFMFSASLPYKFVSFLSNTLSCFLVLSSQKYFSHHTIHFFSHYFTSRGSCHTYISPWGGNVSHQQHNNLLAFMCWKFLKTHRHLFEYTFAIFLQIEIVSIYQKSCKGCLTWRQFLVFAKIYFHYQLIHLPWCPIFIPVIDLAKAVCPCDAEAGMFWKNRVNTRAADAPGPAQPSHQ